MAGKCFSETVSAEELEKLPVAEFRGKIIVVEEPGKVYDEAIEYLSSQPVIGFDTETKPLFRQGAPRNRTALLQLSGEDRAYIFRLNRIGVPESLAAVLASDSVLKIGAAVLDDIRGLQKYFRFEPKGFIDLQKICGQYGIADKSVRKLAAIIMGVKVSKSQRLSNWEADQLTYSQLQYAALDAWICKKMFERLIMSDN